MPAALSEFESVLAIDPGNFQTAYALLSGKKKILAVEKDVSNGLFLGRVSNILRENPQVTIVAVEMIASYGMAVGASVFETCIFIGRLQERLEGLCRFVLVPRLEVKLSVCKSPKANDANIRASLLDEFGPQGNKKNPGPTFGISADGWAALALAETVRRGEYRPYVWSHERP